jgi:hypothetical protein
VRIQEEVAEHQRTRQADSPRDYIDLYLEKLDEEKSINNSTFDGIRLDRSMVIGGHKSM